MKYSPYKIAEEGKIYTIPIYQRLFEWNTENIITLLEDLKKQFERSDGLGDYYIGMLTSTDDNELIDGQQRFTVMMLLGSVMQEYCEEWRRFLFAGNKVRLHFSSRPLDDTYLECLVAHKKDESMLSFKNIKMQNGYRQIRHFMEECENFSPDKRKSFASYIFRHLCFFISNLPKGYSPRDLNKYFERMNTSGKNLEQHEILKVKLLRNLDGDISKYMALWNKLADVDTILIRRRKDENMTELKNKALKLSINELFSQDIISGINDEPLDDVFSIGEISPSALAPKSGRELNGGSRCALSFPYLLLQVLYRKVGQKINCSIKDFFKPADLLEIFEEYLPYSGNNINRQDIKDFMEMLVKARLALDISFIRPTEYGYTLDMCGDEDDDELRNLLMFQSMLYVSSSNYTNYRWFNWLMDIMERTDGVPTSQEVYSYMKKKADEAFPLPKYECLTYREDCRYWFWRLDFYIWQYRKELFANGTMERSIADNYVFRRNRSIEHIAPQTPQSDSMMKWADTEEDSVLRDCFGNLVMISQGLNSALSNESYEVKTAHVQSYCNGSKSGSIESLKLLVVHHDYPNGWNRESIKEHGKKTYEWLKESIRDSLDIKSMFCISD